MWVYGGMTDLQERSDLWKWDIVSRTWQCIKCKISPGPLHSHAACKLPSSMLIFGGERNGQNCNELWKFSFGMSVFYKGNLLRNVSYHKYSSWKLFRKPVKTLNKKFWYLSTSKFVNRFLLKRAFQAWFLHCRSVTILKLQIMGAQKAHLCLVCEMQILEERYLK